MDKKEKKPIITVAAGKGKLLGITDKFLEKLGLEPVARNRELIQYRELPNCILKICILRWDDIKRYANNFDLIIYGCDQWLEDGKKSMIALDYYEQNNCRLSLLVPEKDKHLPMSHFRDNKVATGYPNLAGDYLGIMYHNIVKMSGSVEASVGMGWADSIFDIVESGETAKAQGLVEYKTFLRFGAVVATTKPEMIPMLSDLGLIPRNTNGLTIAFDGLDGSGKSSLAKHLVQEGLGNNAPTVLVCPYSGFVGMAAKDFLKAQKPLEWAITVGYNHWKAPRNANAIYDRSVLTFLTELLKAGCTKQEIDKALSAWDKVDILFYCKAPIQTILKRRNGQEGNDEYDYEESLMEYEKLYEKAVEYLKQNTGIKVIPVDTGKDIACSILEVKAGINETEGKRKMLSREDIKNLDTVSREPVSEGKSKAFYKVTDNLYLMVFKPHLRSITSEREENIEGTDIERLMACLHIMLLAEKEGISTQLAYDRIVDIGGMSGLLVTPAKTIPIEFIVRYYAAGSIVRQFPGLVNKGDKFDTPLLKFDYKQDISVAGIDDPMLNESYITGLGLLTQEQLDLLKEKMSHVAGMVSEELQKASMKLVDIKMEFGFDRNGNILLIDEISQDCIRADDTNTGEPMTKDAFRNMQTDEEVLCKYKSFNERVIGKDLSGLWESYE